MNGDNRIIAIQPVVCPVVGFEANSLTKQGGKQWRVGMRDLFLLLFSHHN